MYHIKVKKYREPNTQHAVEAESWADAVKKVVERVGADGLTSIEPLYEDRTAARVARK